MPDIQPKGSIIYVAAHDAVSGNFVQFLPARADSLGQLQVALRGGGPGTISVYAVNDLVEFGGSSTSPTDQLAIATGSFTLLANEDSLEYFVQREAPVTDAQADIAHGVALTSARLTAYNGSTYDRIRTNGAANLAASTQPFGIVTAQPGEWSINHTPVANTQATITRAAGGSGVRHICRSITATLIGLAAAAETTVLVNLRDGATGAGTILWSARLLVVGTTGSETGISLSNLNIIGSANTAMTLEFAAAGGADTFETVSVSGYDTV